MHVRTVSCVIRTVCASRGQAWLLCLSAHRIVHTIKTTIPPLPACYPLGLRQLRHCGNSDAASQPLPMFGWNHAQRKLTTPPPQDEGSAWGDLLLLPRRLSATNRVHQVCQSLHCGPRGRRKCTVGCRCAHASKHYGFGSHEFCNRLGFRRPVGSPRTRVANLDLQAG